jgi:cytochrome c nitrite reductase small subunit
MSRLKNLISFFLPPDRWKFRVLILCGVFTGLIFLVLHLAKADSYLSDKPETCINCHVMFPQYVSWQKSAHKNITCNQCHVPQDNFFRQYYFKASDGLRHSYMFTFRLEPQVIRIHKAGKEVVQENCVSCHSDLVNHIEQMRYEVSEGKEGRYCWSCHTETPHGKIGGTSSVRTPIVPEQRPVMPEWLNNYLTKTKKR